MKIFTFGAAPADAFHEVAIPLSTGGLTTPWSNTVFPASSQATNKPADKTKTSGVGGSRMKMFTFGHAIEDAVTLPTTVTYQQADAVAKGIATKYPKADWLYGVGIIPSAKEGFRVEVRADPKASVPAIPQRINGVCVSVKRTPMPSAIVGIDSLDSDLMSFKRNPVSWRAEIGGAHLMGEASEERMKGV